MASSRLSAMLHLAKAQTPVRPPRVRRRARPRGCGPPYRQHLRGQAGVDDGGVGDGPGHGQGARPLGGHGDGDACAERSRSSPAHVGPVAPVLTGFSGQHLADGLDVVMQLRQPRRTQPQVQHRAVAAAEAQEGPTAGKLVNRGYGRGGNRRVPGEGIGDRRPQHHPLGGRGHNAQGYVQLAGQRLGVGDAHIVEAHFLRQPRSAGNIRETVGEHGDAEFHYNFPILLRLPMTTLSLLLPARHPARCPTGVARIRPSGSHRQRAELL